MTIIINTLIVEFFSKNYWVMVLFAFAIVITGLVYFLKREPKIKNYPSAGKNIIAFGDSLTEGYGIPRDKNYVSLLSQKIGESIINAGRSGDTTESALARLETDVLDRDPKVVIVLLGGNDYLRGMPRSQTFSNLATIIEKIQEQGAVVILVGIQGGVFRDNFKKEFFALAKIKHTAYVPNILQEILGEKDLMLDIIHPNEKGHEIMAKRIEPVLRDMIRERK